MAQSEPLRGLPPTKDVFVSDGEQFYKHSNWNSSAFVADVMVPLVVGQPGGGTEDLNSFAAISAAAEVQLEFNLSKGINISFVRVYPYFLVHGTEDDPRTHKYASSSYRIRSLSEAGVWYNVTEGFVTSNHPGITLNSSADLVFRDHQLPRLEKLPESLADPVSPREFVNNSWWFVLPLIKTTKIEITLRPEDPSSLRTESRLGAGDVAIATVGIAEVELFSREKQYVPGALVMAMAAKSEDQTLMDTLNSKCCRKAIPCPAGSYCLAGAAHGALFTNALAAAFAATGGKDFEAPQIGIAGNYYSEGTADPLGSAQCPSGYYCPSGSAIPRPCWRGHLCAGTGVVLPTACPTGSYGNVGVPAYIYDWESFWPLSNNAALMMSRDLSLMYNDAMLVEHQRQQQQNSTIVLPFQKHRFWYGMGKFLSDFPASSWKTTKGYAGGFAAGQRSILQQNGVSLFKNYTNVLTEDKPCASMRLTSRQNETWTVPGVKDISPRRASTLWIDYFENFSIPDSCDGNHGDSFTVETWVAPLDLSASYSHTVLSSGHEGIIADDGSSVKNSSGWVIRAQKYQEGYRWSCHVREEDESANIRLSLFGNSTNGTENLPLRADTTARNLLSILESVAAADKSKFSVYIMGLNPSDRVCTSGNQSNTNRSFYIHFYDVESRLDACAYNNSVGQHRTVRQCRKRLDNDTALNLGETSGRSTFPIDWPALVLGVNGSGFDAEMGILKTEGGFHNKMNTAAAPVDYHFTLERREFHRWEFGIRNGSHENIITGPRVAPYGLGNSPETGAHVSGTAFQTSYKWQHVVARFDSNTVNYTLPGCKCEATWNYLGDTYRNCATTLDWPQAKWCYVENATLCGEEQGTYPSIHGTHQEVRRWRECSLGTASLLVDNQDATDLYFVTNAYKLEYKQVTMHRNNDESGGREDKVLVIGNGANMRTNKNMNRNMSLATFHMEDPYYFDRMLSDEQVRSHFYAMLDESMGQEACTPCQGGQDCQKTSTNDHIVVPSPCVTGKYRNQASSLVSCSSCPEGRYSLQRGLRHYSECQLCPEGLVCQVEAANNLEFTPSRCLDDDMLEIPCQAILCPDNAVCGMGTKKEIMLEVKCPPGYHCMDGTCPDGRQVLSVIHTPSTGVVTTNRTKEGWYDCPSEYYCDEGTTLTTKKECAPGHFCPTGSAMYCCNPACRIEFGDLPYAEDGSPFWKSKCNSISLQSANLDQEMTDFALKYPWSTILPVPKNLGQTCKTGTTSLRLANNPEQCFVDWDRVTSTGSYVYIFPFAHVQVGSSADVFIRTPKSVPDVAPPNAWGNASWSRPFGCTATRAGYMEDEVPPLTSNIESVLYYKIQDLPRAALPALSVARLTFNFTSLPRGLKYDDHFRISLFLDSSTSTVPSGRILLPQRFYNMVNDEQARLFTEGRSGQPEVSTALPELSVTGVRSDGTRIYHDIRLKNAPDRPLSGTFQVTVEGASRPTSLGATAVNVTVSAQASADEFKAALVSRVPELELSFDVAVTRSWLTRLDKHAGYTWTVSTKNTTGNHTSTSSLHVGSPTIPLKLSVLTRSDGSIPGLKRERVYEFDILIRKVRKASVFF